MLKVANNPRKSKEIEITLKHLKERSLVTRSLSRGNVLLETVPSNKPKAVYSCHTRGVITTKNICVSAMCQIKTKAYSVNDIPCCHIFFVELKCLKDSYDTENDTYRFLLQICTSAFVSSQQKFGPQSLQTRTK